MYIYVCKNSTEQFDPSLICLFMSYICDWLCENPPLKHIQYLEFDTMSLKSYIRYSTDLKITPNITLSLLYDI